MRDNMLTRMRQAERLSKRYAEELPRRIGPEAGSADILKAVRSVTKANWHTSEGPSWMVIEACVEVASRSMATGLSLRLDTAMTLAASRLIEISTGLKPTLAEARSLAIVADGYPSLDAAISSMEES